MWLLVKYPRFSATPIAVESFDEYPEYEPFSRLLINEQVKPEHIPRMYAGASKEVGLHTIRMIQANVKHSEKYWAEQDRERVVRDQLTKYKGMKGMADLSKEQAR